MQEKDRIPHQQGGMLQMGARIILVPGFIIAIAFMLKGYVDIGDGFSGGVIAALVVITQGLAFGADEMENIPAARLAPLAGFVGLGLAYSLAFVPVMFGHDVLSHFPAMNNPVLHFGALEFITPVLFDVAVFLVVYGFCVGAMMAVSRAEVRHQRLIRRARKQAGTRGGDGA
jgi:multicomponent Na+:H+ antiporter subunit B